MVCHWQDQITVLLVRLLSVLLVTMETILLYLFWTIRSILPSCEKIKISCTPG